MEQFVYVSANTTVMTVNTSDLPTTQKVVVLQADPAPNFTLPTYETGGRVLYFKEVTGISNVSQFRVDASGVSAAPGGLVILPSTHQLTVSSLNCLAMQLSPADKYNLLTMYRGSKVFSTMEMPSLTSVAVSASGSNSSLFVDLTYESKAVVLPTIPSLTGIYNKSPYFVIKDIYGNANTKPLFISTSGGASIDGLGPSIAMRNPFGAVELLGDLSANRWHIVNSYAGNYPDATIGPLIESQHTVSSSIVNVGVSSLSKVVYLPPASTVKGATFLIRDVFGKCSPISSIYISTVGLDTMDITKKTAQLNTSLQSFRVIAHNSTNYSVLQNYSFGFQY
jgi:hypothetical protein